MNRKFLITLVILFLCLVTLVEVSEAAKKSKKNKNAAATASSDTPVDVKGKSDATESTAASRAAARAKQIDLLQKRLIKREERAQARLKRARPNNDKYAKTRRERAQKIKAFVENERKKLDATVKAKVSSEKPETRRKGEEKLKWLQQQVGKKSTRIIDMDPDQFKRYLNAGPRPYWTFVTLTALGSQYNCQLCTSAHNALLKLASTYHTHRKNVMAINANETDISNTTVTKEALDAPPVFFVNIDVEKNRPIFDALGLQSAPTMVLLPPLTSDKNPKLNSFLTGLPSQYKYIISRPDFTAEDFESFISKHTGVSVKEKGLATMDSSTLIKFLALGVVVLGIVSTIIYRNWVQLHDFVYGQTKFGQTGTPHIINTSYGRDLIKHMASYKLSRRKMLIAIVAWAGYGFCISGGMYNIIRGTQWEGRNEWISGDSHDQYGVESIIIGVINISLAFSVVMAVLRAFITIELDHPQEETSTSTLKKIMGALFLPFQFVVNYFLIPVCIVAVAYIWYQLVVIYTRKNWSYHYGWVIGQPKWW